MQAITKSNFDFLQKELDLQEFWLFVKSYW